MNGFAGCSEEEVVRYQGPPVLGELGFEVGGGRRRAVGKVGHRERGAKGVEAIA